jgi:ubiquinone/menaquinone biosynthesis C-methylase UbiE
MSEIINYYDNLAQNYDYDRFTNSYGKFIDRQERKILNKLFSKKDELVLELACGSGRLLNYAVYGVDGSQEMIKIAQQKYPNKEIFYSDAEILPFENNSFDAIISFHFFMHLDKEKLLKILEECSRVLKPGGRLIFDIPSARRRKLLAYNKDGWHGNLALSKADITKLHPKFVVKRSFGLLFLPIHRIPNKIRMRLIGVDFLFANSFLKKYSSYHVYEMIKK